MASAPSRPQESIRRAPSAQLKDQLASLLGDRFTTSRAVCAQHGTDESAFEPRPPDGVAFPGSTEEVAQVVQLCAAERVPVIAFGVGSSVEGHLLAVQGGVCIDLSRMNGVLAT